MTSFKNHQTADIYMLSCFSYIQAHHYFVVFWGLHNSYVIPNLEVTSVPFEFDIVNYHFIHSLNVLLLLYTEVQWLCFHVFVCAFVSIHASLKTMTVMK